MSKNPESRNLFMFNFDKQKNMQMMHTDATKGTDAIHKRHVKDASVANL